jgi:hypothetical protein
VADGPARLRQPLPERYETGLRFGIVRGRAHEHPDAPHSLALLRARRERPRRRAAEQGDEIPPPHSITSSARAQGWKAVDCLANTWAYCPSPSSSSQAAARVIDALSRARTAARAHPSGKALACPRNSFFL